jgi:hypothetical protein
MNIEFNPFTGNFDLVTPEDKSFGPFTTFDCGLASEFDSSWFHKIDCGEMPSTGKIRKIDLGEAI